MSEVVIVPVLLCNGKIYQIILNMIKTNTDVVKSMCTHTSQMANPWLQLMKLHTHHCSHINPFSYTAPWLETKMGALLLVA